MTAKRFFKLTGAMCLSLGAITANAQNYIHYSSEKDNYWKQSNAKLSGKATHTILDVKDAEIPNMPFKAWGATFNELDWDALQMLSQADRNNIVYNLFNPAGDLKLSLGRISPGANDYARSWYSCDEVSGDLELKYFNIDRDREAIIPFIKSAQEQNPDMRFWASPWSPPSWMKINHDYPVLSSKYNNQPQEIDYILFSGIGGEPDADEMKLTGPRDGVFPRQLATVDYFIQDPRYLQAYANYFCKFIDEYKKEGIDIGMVMYQNEAYSYTPYPGCAWTTPSIQRFNRDYLAPTLKRQHPDVKLFLGTFNTNRLDHVEDVLSDEGLRNCISGMGFQWEGREILPEIRRQHPDWEYMSTESECGWGSFDHGAGEHTFELINHYLSNGCTQYNFWNVILADNGESPWGWKQNALIRVDSAKGTATFTPEYYAVKHYANFIDSGSVVEAAKGEGEDKIPVLKVKRSDGKTIIVIGNLKDSPADVTVKVGNKYLNTTLAPHSMHTFVEK